MLIIRYAIYREFVGFKGCPHFESVPRLFEKCGLLDKFVVRFHPEGDSPTISTSTNPPVASSSSLLSSSRYTENNKTSPVCQTRSLLGATKALLICQQSKAIVKSFTLTESKNTPICECMYLRGLAYLLRRGVYTIITLCMYIHFE